jgi:hypothetical protein
MRDLNAGTMIGRTTVRVREIPGVGPSRRQPLWAAAEVSADVFAHGWGGFFVL